MPICFKLIGGQGDFYGVKRNKTMDRGTLPNPGARPRTEARTRVSGGRVTGAIRSVDLYLPRCFHTSGVQSV